MNITDLLEPEVRRLLPPDVVVLLGKEGTAWVEMPSGGLVAVQDFIDIATHAVNFAVQLSKGNSDGPTA